MQELATENTSKTELRVYVGPISFYTKPAPHWSFVVQQTGQLDQFVIGADWNEIVFQRARWVREFYDILGPEDHTA
jgi:hypothetical protein